MNKHLIKLFSIIVILLVGVCSCGRNSNHECSLTVDGVFCDNSEVFSVSDEIYKLVNKDNSLRLKVKFLLKNSSDMDIDLYPEVVLKDEDGMEIIDGWYQMGLSDYEKQKFDKFVAGELGNEVEILFTNEFNDKLFKKVLSVANKFAVTNFRLKSSKNFIVNDSVEDLDSIEDILDAANDIVNNIDDIDDEDYQDLIDDYKKTMELTKDAMV